MTPSRSGYRALPWAIAFFAWALAVFATVWYPVRRSFAHFEINYNEGWNAYRAKMVQDGLPLYAAPPHYTLTNYPPLSFHFVALLGHLTGDVLTAGRYLSLVSVLLIAVLIGAIVQRLTTRRQAAWFAGLSFIAWLALCQPDRIGMDDPQLFASVFSLLGLYAYLAKPHSRVWLCVSAGAFVVSVFTKHNLLAFPLAVGAHLLLTRSFKRLAIWAGVFCAAAAVLFFGSILVDGRYFWAHLTVARPYSIADGVFRVHNYLGVMQIPIAAALVWAVWNSANTSRNILAIALVMAHGIAVAFSGGFGVDGNIYFDCIMTLVMILGVAAGDLAPAIQSRRFGNLILTAALLAPLLGILPVLPGRIAHDYGDFKAIPLFEDDFRQSVDFLAAQPGPVLCNDLLLCFAAGKPEEVDTFMVGSQMKLGKLPEAEFLNLIATRRFDAIEYMETNDGLIPGVRGLTDRIGGGYHLGLRTNWYGILVSGRDFVRERN